MWTVEDMFGLPIETARVYIVISSFFINVFRLLNIVLLRVYVVSDFYVDCFGIKSQNESKQSYTMYKTLITIYIVLDVIGLIATLIFLITMKAQKPWIIIHAIITAVFAISIIFVSAALHIKFIFNTPAVFASTYTISLATGFFFFIWNAVRYDYKMKKKS